ncbi:L-glutamine:2-deoxy-scyllo-inosose aminotransferase [Caulifigura coniformis]|uniref:L-glutamine:2-deoxy-scyllo-inosose aminotransferase n=1 Tax=Caulifigura coniformis TaxID=2527983 RepID=A0A517SIV9_9PLAN|nr:L-glutamine:2-deoxy-scyllo-inosose aminotransferase [Caulifigura coniformis]
MVDAVRQAADEGAWGRYVGRYGDELRALLRERHGVGHAWLCSSGTAAVELALRGLGVVAGDEVILAAYDFKANFTDVLAIGALPVLVDVRADDWQLDVDKVRDAMTSKTKAILISHLHGGSVDLARLREIVGDGVPIVEDACQCPGSVIDGRPAGSAGDVGVLSFGGSKLTAAGRGGAVLTDRGDVIERIKRHVMRGNDLSPLSELQAAALVPQWRSLDEQNEQRRRSTRSLHGLMAEITGLRMLIPPDHSRAAGYYKVGFEYDPTVMAGLSRETFCLAMRSEGIAFWPGFRSLHRIHAARRFRAAGPLPVADRADGRIVLLHHPVLLGTDADIEQIVVALRKIQHAASDLSRRSFEIPPAPWDRDE